MESVFLLLHLQCSLFLLSSIVLRGCSVAQSCPTLCNPWTVAHQVPLSMGFFQARTLEWVANSSPRGSSLAGAWSASPASPSLAGRFFTTSATWEASIVLLLLLSHFSHVRICATDPVDSSPSGSPVPGILQARTLEWVAISFSNVWKWKLKVKSLSCVRLLVTPWTAAYQAPPSMGFSRQEYWSGVPLLGLI